MKKQHLILFLLPLFAALVLGILHFAGKLSPVGEDWDAMQDALSNQADPSTPNRGEASPSPRLPEPSARAINLPDEPPPGGPFTPDGRDALPGLGQPGYDYLLTSWVEQRVTREDLDAVDLAARLLAAPVPSERVAGAVILAALGVLDADAIIQLASDEDPAVPLNLLGWLRDHGDEANAEILRDALTAEDRTADRLTELVSEPALSAAGRRALIELAAGSGGEPVELSTWLLATAGTPRQPLDVRAKAAVELRGLMEPGDLAQRLSADNLPRSVDQGGAPDPGFPAVGERTWPQLRERLTRDLKAPPGLERTGEEVSLMDFQEWTGSGTVLLQLVETASRLEFALNRPDARVEPGVADAVLEYLDQVESGQPLPPDLQLAVRRIHSRLPMLYAVEAAGPDLHSGLSPP